MNEPVALQYWVYENTIHKKTRVHLSTCSFCNHGRGIHGGGKTGSGEWFGPFDSLDAAITAAKRRGHDDLRSCETCLALKQLDRLQPPLMAIPFAAPSKHWEWDTAQDLSCSLTLRWIPKGQITLDDANKLRFPVVEIVPGLYRIRALKPDKRQSVYIGESDNLARRFGNYRNPGPTQQTSLRINGALFALLSNGGQLSLSIAESTTITTSLHESSADLSSKSIRRLFENFALSLEARGDRIEHLNR
jgi:hypothetical protein